MRHKPVENNLSPASGGGIGSELLMWIGPLMLFGLYLGAAWLLSRWNENEMLLAFLLAISAGLFGLIRLPMRFVHKALIACWYLPMMVFLLFAMTYGLGCGLFGRCL